jgi:hypothetical protein
MFSSSTIQFIAQETGNRANQMYKRQILFYVDTDVSQPANHADAHFQAQDAEF